MLCGCSVCHSAILTATIWGFGAARQDIWHFFLSYTFFLKELVLGCQKPRELIARMPSSPMIIFMIQTNISLKHNIWPYQKCSQVIMTKTFCCKLEHLCLWTFERLAWKLKWFFWLAEAQFWVTCWIWICAEIGWLCSRNALRSDFNTFCVRGLFYIPTFAVPRREREREGQNKDDMAVWSGFSS